jgi:hypothetical protein
MAYELDANGYLDVDQLTLEEKREIYAKFQNALNQAGLPSEIGDMVMSDELSEEELAKKIESTADELIWTDYYILNTDEAETLQLVHGLSVSLAGPCIVHGYREQESVSGYIFATNPPLNPVAIFYSAECQCPFCWAGSTDDGDCEICEGSGMWEWMN